MIQSQESQLLISDEEIMNMGEAEIAIAKQPSGGESMSFNNLLNSFLAEICSKDFGSSRERVKKIEGVLQGMIEYMEPERELE